MLKSNAFWMKVKTSGKGPNGSNDFRGKESFLTSEDVEETFLSKSPFGMQMGIVYK